ICVVCRSLRSKWFFSDGASLAEPPTYHLRSPTGDKPYPLHKGNLLLSYISPSTWGNQGRARNHYHHLAHQCREVARLGRAQGGSRRRWGGHGRAGAQGFEGEIHGDRDGSLAIVLIAFRRGGELPS